jgi:glycosyltransferase involved in cell wall biosynthesis
MTKAGLIGRLSVFLYNLMHNKKIICVHTFHGNVFKAYFDKQLSTLIILIERLMSKLTNHIIAISNTQMEELVKEFQITSTKKVKMIELGFDLDAFMDGSALKGKFRKRLNLKNDTLLIGIVGRLAPIKNHMMFLKAANKYVRQNPNMDVKFVIVGDGELRKNLESFCIDQELNNHVIFCGWIRDIHSVYVDLDILALTSLNEGTPVSIIEAMASSVPVIATDAGGVIDLIGKPVESKSSNGFRICDRGLLCNKNDVSGFLNGLKWLIENRNTPDKEKFVNEAESFVKAHYSYKRLISDMEEFYTDIVKLSQKCV